MLRAHKNANEFIACTSYCVFYKLHSQRSEGKKYIFETIFTPSYLLLRIFVMYDTTTVEFVYK